MTRFPGFLLTLSIIFLPVRTSQAVPPSTTQSIDSTKALDTAWENLTREEPWCSQALLDFYSRPDQTVPYLAQHLQPLKLDPNQLDDLLKKLSSDDEKVWKPAFETLHYFDPRLATDPESMMESATAPLLRERLAAVLTHSPPERFKDKEISIRKSNGTLYLENSSGNFRSSWGLQSKVSRLEYSHPEWQRADRALVLLQHLGTPQAFDVIRKMADANRHALTTLIAQAALAQGAGPATTQPGSEDKLMEHWWDDLEKNEPWDTKALLNFTSQPVRAVAFLKAHLKPIRIDKKELDTAIADLASEDDKIWKPAFDKLEYYDPRLVYNLEEMFDTLTASQQRLRMACLISGYSSEQWTDYEVSLEKNNDRLFFKFMKNGGWSSISAETRISNVQKSSWTRLERGIVLLQFIGGPDAITTLKNLTTGHPSAVPTKLAQAALDSLQAKTK